MPFNLPLDFRLDSSGYNGLTDIPIQVNGNTAEYSVNKLNRYKIGSNQQSNLTEELVSKPSIPDRRYPQNDVQRVTTLEPFSKKIKRSSQVFEANDVDERIRIEFEACLRATARRANNINKRYFIQQSDDAARESLDSILSESESSIQENSLANSTPSTILNKAILNSPSHITSTHSVNGCSLSYHLKRISSANNVTNQCNKRTPSLSQFPPKGYREIAGPLDELNQSSRWCVLHVCHIRPNNRRICSFCQSASHITRFCKKKRCLHCGALSHDTTFCPHSNIICDICAGIGHRSKRCPSAAIERSIFEGPTSPNTNRCITCGGLGHLCCRKNLPQSKPWTYCSHCGLHGHLFRSCRRKKENASLSTVKQQEFSKHFAKRLMQNASFVIAEDKEDEEESSSDSQSDYTFSKHEVDEQKRKNRRAIKAKKRRRRKSEPHNILFAHEKKSKMSSEKTKSFSDEDKKSKNVSSRSKKRLGYVNGDVERSSNATICSVNNRKKVKSGYTPRKPKRHQIHE